MNELASDSDPEENRCMLARRACAALGVACLAIGCSNVLGYDEVSFEPDGTGAASGAAGAGNVGNGGGGNVGNGGSGNVGNGGSGNVANGGAGNVGNGGTGNVGTGGTGNVGNGGTGNVANGGTGNAATGGGGSPSGGAPSGGGGSPSGGGGSPSGGGGSPSGGGGSPSGGGGSPSGGGGSPSGGGGSPSGGGGSPSGGGGSGGTTTGHYETLTNPTGSGSEPGGLIPVCCVPSSTEASLISQGFTLLNQHRLANGISALAYDTKLEAAIEGHTHHMSVHSFFDHNAPESAVTTPWTRANLCGTSANGENIFWGSSSAQSAMNAWIGSPGHNANMLNGSFKRVGIGNYNTYWGQIFGN